MIYTKEHANSLWTLLSKVETIKFLTVSLSTLGGAHHASLMVTVSLDAKEAWSHSILHNSRYAMFSVESTEHKLEQFSGLYLQAKKKFRKCKAETVEQIAEKIKTWAEANA